MLLIKRCQQYVEANAFQRPQQCRNAMFELADDANQFNLFNMPCLSWQMMPTLSDHASSITVRLSQILSSCSELQ